MVTPSLSPRSRGPDVLLVAFTLLALSFLAYFERHDGRPPTYDDAWYLETSLRMYNALSEGRLVEFIYEYCGAFGGSKAPLISVMPLPFYFLFGKRIDPTFWVNGLFLVVGNFCLYGLVRRWYPAVTGLVAVVVYQTFPIVAGLSRAPMTENTGSLRWLSFSCATCQRRIRLARPSAFCCLGSCWGSVC